jgi:hypothetical protein
VVRGDVGIRPAPEERLNTSLGLGLLQSRCTKGNRRERNEPCASNQGSRLAPGIGCCLRAGYRWNRIGAAPITGTDVSTFSDSFTGSLDCRDEPYAITVTGHTVLNFTYFEETGALYFHLVDHGKGVAIPLDGTGPSYTANFFDFDLEGIRAVKNGDVLVEEDTDLFRTAMHGSDGSRTFFYFHAHFTVNANLTTTVQLEMDRLICI